MKGRRVGKERPDATRREKSRARLTTSTFILSYEIATTLIRS